MNIKVTLTQAENKNAEDTSVAYEDGGQGLA